MNLKELFEAVNNDELLLEGGAAGHMMHPYDKYREPEDLIQFFEDFLSGKMEGTEKVDGYNLFAGYNEEGNVVAVRNKNQPPIENITDKFSLQHGAYAGFTAGWKAIKSGLEKLSKSDREKYNLVDEDGQPKNFINLEILFGYIPNVVPYNQTTNYIVFHGFAGSPENDWEPQDADNQKKALQQLANKLGSVSTTSSEMLFRGDVEDVERKRKTVQSFWEFKGPIDITKKDIEEQLRDLYQEWKSYPEVEKLRKYFGKKELSGEEDEERFKLMKSLTKKVGSKVLQNMVSKLSETGKIVKGHPGMEGIVLKRNGDLVKITGDFLDYSKPEDVPTFDATKSIREYVQKELLGLTTNTIKVKSLAAVEEYIMDRKKKKYTYILDDKLPEGARAELTSAITESQQRIKDAIDELRDKGRDYDIRSLLSQAYILSEFKKAIRAAESYEDIVIPYAQLFFNIKRKR